MNICVYVYLYIYTYTYICTYVHMYIYMYIMKEIHEYLKYSTYQNRGEISAKAWRSAQPRNPHMCRSTWCKANIDTWQQWWVSRKLPASAIVCSNASAVNADSWKDAHVRQGLTRLTRMTGRILAGTTHDACSVELTLACWAARMQAIGDPYAPGAKQGDMSTIVCRYGV